MIDPTLRLDLLADQAADPEVAVLLLDVVLGHAADPDPALRLAPAISAAIASAAAAGRTLSVVVALCGTASDPQDRGAQAAALVAASICGASAAPLIAAPIQRRWRRKRIPLAAHAWRNSWQRSSGSSR